MSMISRFWNEGSSPSHTPLNSFRSDRIDADSITLPTRPKSSSSRISASGSARSSRPIGESAHSLLALNRYEYDIQRRFQSLLDVQAERLLALTGSPDVDSQSLSDAGSSTTRSNRASESGKVIPVRQPTPQRLSLGATRREISNALQELSAIKEKERRIYATEIRNGEETTSRIEAWEKQRQGLNDQIRDIQSNDRKSRIQTLTDENDALQEQINALENQLMELRSQQNAVKLELSRLENSAQSELSSYTESLRIIENEIQKFLSQSPSTIPNLHADHTAYQSLPPSRRTLKLALEHTQEDILALKERLQSSQEEAEATHEGHIVWRDVVSAVTNLEQHMRKVLANSADTTQEGSASKFSRLLDDMDQIITDLDSKMKLSDARGWKLLVCCIGAELEALQKGRTIMAEAIHGEGTTQPSESNSQTNSSQDTSDTEPTARKSSEIGNVETESTRGYKVPLDTFHAATYAQPARKPGSFSRQAGEAISDSPPRRGSSETVRRNVLRRDANGTPPSDSAGRSGSGGEGSTRRSIDSFRRRNDRNAARAYRPEDDEPGLDLLIADPDPIDE